MPYLFGRLGTKPIKRSAGSQSTPQPLRGQAHATPVDGFQTNQIPSNPLLERKIHPDLNSLVAEENSAPIQSTDITLAVPPVVDKMQEFTPLPPSTRRRTASTREQPTSADLDGLVVSSKSPSPGIMPTIDPTELGLSNKEDRSEFTAPTEKSTVITEGVWSTFGRTAHRFPLGEFGEKTNMRPSTPVTQGSSNSQLVESDTQLEDTPESALGSRSSSSYHRNNNPHNSVSSPHTFGIPTPPSSGFTFGSRRRFDTSFETPPPLPPLSHPAFSSNNMGNPFSSKTRSTGKNVRQTKHPRHTSSLPSLFQRNNNILRSPDSPKHGRRRARTQSRTKVMEIFPRSRTPTIYTSTPRHRQHSRSQSKGSNSSRRFSAEFSAVQASSSVHDNKVGESWEAQVSREMVRMSLEEKQERSDYQKVADIAKSGKARGNTSTRADALGSPFLLQDAPTHNIPGTKSDDLTTEYSFVATRASKGKGKIPTMSKGDASGAEKGPDASRSSPLNRTRTPSPPSKLNTIPYPAAGAPSSSLLMPPALSFTAPTPQASPISPIRPTNQNSPTDPPTSVLRPPSTPPAARTISTSSQKGKRKADEAEVEGGGTPPKETREPRATFAVEPRPHRASANSGSSRAPSSYQRKRVRLSMTPERPTSPGSKDNQNASNTGSWSSRHSGHPASQHSHKIPPPSYQPQAPHRTPSRRSLSQASIPMSALISPHAPSVSRSATFHMRDPRKPGPIQTTPWSLSFPSSDSGEGWRRWVERGGSPLHAWLFFFGFVIFPTWWVASFIGIPKTRRLGNNEVEKGVVLDDPQVEFDAKSWRNRCRVLAVISLFTYIPFVVLVAIFAR